MPRSMTPKILIGFPSILLLVTAAAAQDSARPSPAATMVEEREMSCQELTAQINAPAPAEQGVATSAKPKKKNKGFSLGKMLGAASPLMGMAGRMGSAVASTAMSVAGNAASRSTVSETASTDPQAQEQQYQAFQRKQRLEAIFDEKKC